MGKAGGGTGTNWGAYPGVPGLEAGVQSGNSFWTGPGVVADPACGGGGCGFGDLAVSGQQQECGLLSYRAGADIGGGFGEFG